MSRPSPPVLRPMQYEDIGSVVAIDRLSFPIPWTFNTYRYEIMQNPTSTMVVLSMDSDTPPPAPEHHSLIALLERLLGRRPASSQAAIIGYGGFWFSQRRAHISTIAVHPEYRGRGFGEVVLAGMIRRAIGMKARAISLEVRVSNTPAIALYRKYGFTQFGVKPAYYRDNGENAYDLRVAPVDDAYRGYFARLWAALRERVAFVDHFTTVGTHEDAPHSTHTRPRPVPGSGHSRS